MNYTTAISVAISDKSLSTQHNTATANAFHGEIDEVRVSWGVPGPSEFMRQKNDYGFTLIIR